jgi:hypothetical protein
MGVESENAVATPGKAFSDSTPILHREHAHGVAIGDPAIPVRDADSNALLGADLGTDAGGRAGLDQGRGREAAEKLDALVLQDGGDGLDDFHRMSSLPPPQVWHRW